MEKSCLAPLFGNSAYGKTINNKEGFVSTTYVTEKVYAPEKKIYTQLRRKLKIQDFKT
jgi:hypothetical protein